MQDNTAMGSTAREMRSTQSVLSSGNSILGTIGSIGRNVSRLGRWSLQQSAANKGQHHELRRMVLHPLARHHRSCHLRTDIHGSHHFWLWPALTVANTTARRAIPGGRQLPPHISNTFL
jgi:hypothetical protein